MQEDHSKYFETLELPVGATYSEVRAAYTRLKELYSGSDSIVIVPLEEELSDEWRDSVLQRIEEAYEKISEYYRNGGQAAATVRGPALDRKTVSVENTAEHAGDGDEIQKKLEDIGEFSGEGLKKVRQVHGMEIHEVSLATKIAKQHLINIENENFPVLPEEVFLRGYLITCAKTYYLDPDKVVSDYLGRYRTWKQGQ